MKRAIVDLGTNTFNLLVRSDSGEVYINTKIPVKLGEGGITEGKIAPAAFERGLAALETYADMLANEPVDEAWAFATAAIREAANGPEFVAAAFERSKFKVNVISGEEEAAFIAAGVRRAVPLNEHPVLIMDIGGGSTEFVICNATEVFWLKSYPLGLSRLLQTFRPADPMLPREKQEIEDFLDDALVELWVAAETHQPRTLVGSSGSFDTLAEMAAIAQGRREDFLDVLCYHFEPYHFNQLARKLLDSTVDERMNMPGMIPMRADTIVFSCLLVQRVMARARLNQLLVSAYSLKEGVFETLKTDPTPWQKSW